jgi:galactose-1-phosphate uridylyltransferase
MEFRKLVESSTYLNPLENFEPREGRVEIRWDPLTTLTSRVVHFPFRKIERFDAKKILSSSRTRCPFCDENRPSMTTRLDKTIFGAECLQKGEVTLIPNLLSFDKYSLVAIISKDHYVDMAGLAKRGSIIDGITMLLDGFRLIKRKDDSARYFSVNCNYMPMSGGSLVHPHIQGIAGEYPTNYHRITLEKSKEFYENRKKVFWETLIEEEKRLGMRFIGETGTTTWYAPFAPKGNIDVGFIFNTPSFFSLTDRDWTGFASGLNKILNYLDKENVGGFNLSIFSGEDSENHFRVNGRIVARRFLPPANAADVNYFEKIHMESTCLLAPEEVARQLRETWQTDY